MQSPVIPTDEYNRMQELNSYSILDTLPEEEYEDITNVASFICGTPISLISLIDDKRQWFKSNHGLDVRETPREYSFCAHAIHNPADIMVVPDSRVDPRFFDNPLVLNDPFVIFYAGVPLVTPNGYALGTLCVIDKQPRTLNTAQLDALQALAHQLSHLFELRKKKIELESIRDNLMLKNTELEQFAFVAAHDIKSPLNNIVSITTLLMDNYFGEIEPEMGEFLGLLHNSSNKLRLLVDGILNHSRSDKYLESNKEKTELQSLFKDIVQLVASPIAKIEYPRNEQTVFINRVAFEQIIINLITNGIKYNDKEKVIIEIGFEESDQAYNFNVKDNGPGIREEDMDKIFALFNVLTAADRFGKRGNGIGLATVKKLIEGQGGEISVESELGKWTKFSFKLPKY